ncbi:MAG: NADH-quinone oxidoreductase subunit M, partial [Bacteroidia bacterium]|nr:NADH-quinone oxidoreductase subunit M [Bacteroidia bacterium]
MTNLTILILLPLITALLVLLGKTTSQIRWVSLIGSLVQLVLASLLMKSYYAERASGNTAQMLFEHRCSWFKPLNIEYYVGIDGISMVMIMMTAFVVVAGILISWKVETLTKEFFFLLL